MAKNDVQVRRAQAADAERIAEFNRRLASESEGLELDEATVRQGVRRLLENPSLGCYFLAESSAEIVGQLGLTYEWSDWRNGLFWWIQSVYVVPEVRRAGVFRQLFHAVETQALEDPGCCGLRLYVEGENERALETYQALGLEQAPYQMLELDFTDPDRGS